jgi:hypothetical protein
VPIPSPVVPVVLPSATAEAFGAKKSSAARIVVGFSLRAENAA